MSAAASAALQQARTWLVLEHPFLGALVLHLPLVPSDAPWCPTLATDAVRLYYRPDFVATCPPAELACRLAHSALHCALGQFARRRGREPERWDRACDLAVNGLLLRAGLVLPAAALVDTGRVGLDTEAFYRQADLPPGVTLDGHLFHPGHRDPRTATAGRPPPPGAQQTQSLEHRWRQRLVTAAQAARRAGRLDALLAHVA